ncbi:MAG: pyruvate kinase [Phycisphaerae bacterium]
MLIRTKILATVGPACGEVEDLRRMVRAGCDALRINFSHGDDEQRQRFLDNIRAVEHELSEPLAVMADLCGPKIRVGPISGGSVLLADGQEVAIQREPLEGRADRISTTLAELVDCVKLGDTILLDDGRIRLAVVETDPPDEIRCQVVHGGVLAEGKGVNLPDTKLSIPAMTEKDHRDIAWIAQRDFDYVALSFVQSADDVELLKRLLPESGSEAHVVAKIEKPQALADIERIIESADAVMVARGDLGVEMDLPEVPIAQKRIAALCRRGGKPCIIATQMLESMTHSPQPTRAEVSDVANAVLDCTDAVMLSGETAVGKYPAETVAMMDSIVRETENYQDTTGANVEVTYAPARTTAALAGAVGEIIRREDISAVAVFTSTGTTARVMSKNRPPVPILALSPDEKVVRRMRLYYGVQPVRADAPEHTRDVLTKAADFAVRIGAAEKGQKMLVLSGRPIGTPGTTNTLVVHTVE